MALREELNTVTNLLNSATKIILEHIPADEIPPKIFKWERAKKENRISYLEKLRNERLREIADLVNRKKEVVKNLDKEIDELTTELDVFPK